jgi:predicted acetyltransferase
MIKIVNITEEYKDRYYEMINEWKKDNHQLVPCIIDYDCNHKIYEDTYKNLMDVVNDYRSGLQKDKEYYESSSFYFIVDESNLIGSIEIRHNLSELGRNTIGHIAIGIRPSKRGNGYAKKAVNLAIDMLKNDNIKEAIMCHYKENNLSERMIKSLGFKLKNITISKVSGKEICCYTKEI